LLFYYIIGIYVVTCSMSQSQHAITMTVLISTRELVTV